MEGELLDSTRARARIETDLRVTRMERDALAAERESYNEGLQKALKGREERSLSNAQVIASLTNHTLTQSRNHII